MDGPLGSDVERHGAHHANVPHPSQQVPRLRVHSAKPEPGERTVPEETAIAFSYNRLSHAVMMATPADLEDFAVGFSLTEGIVPTPAAIEELAIVPSPHGVELRMWVDPAVLARLESRRRLLAGPTGCGLCGLESLEQALREPPVLPPGGRVTPAEINAALAAMEARQPLGQATRAVHAAALWQIGGGLLAVREDVGRHNALDKLAGAAARTSVDTAACMILLTSRISVELIQKAARIGAPILCAVSAPTALALRVAHRAGLTVVGVARRDGFEVFTHPNRIVERA